MTNPRSPTMTSVPVQCRCGKVRGEALEVSPKTTTHIVCYCTDCRAFARWLGGDGLLDDAGGSDIVQMAPSRLRITEGLGEVRCLRLSPKGMHRWYAACCRTPIGNTMGPGVPFVGVPRAFMGDVSDATLGPPTRVMGRSAVGTPPPGTHAKASAGFMFTVARRLGGWWLGGKGKPSPFFEAKVPRATPQVLTPDERATLDR